MTPAEKIAQEVENLTPFTDGDSVVRDDAAALIRRLAAALSDVYSNEYIFVQDHLAVFHAEALRDVKEDA